MLPKISVITAVYNNERHIESALKSVLSQTYANVEYIVIDGGSRDRTMDIVRRYQDRIHSITSEPDGGIYDALNKGISKATGDVIGFLHSDDIFASDRTLENVANAFQKQAVDGVYADLNYILETGDHIRIIRHWKSNTFQKAQLKSGWMPPHPTLYLKKSVYDACGTFNLDYRISADYDFILRAFGNPEYRFHYLPEVAVQMRVGGASNRNLKKIFQKSSEDYRILTSHGYQAASTLLFKNLSKIGQFFSRSKS